MFLLPSSQFLMIDFICNGLGLGCYKKTIKLMLYSCARIMASILKNHLSICYHGMLQIRQRLQPQHLYPYLWVPVIASNLHLINFSWSGLWALTEEKDSESHSKHLKKSVFPSQHLPVALSSKLMSGPLTYIFACRKSTLGRI